VLPPWALLALVVAAAILLCVALVYLVKALRGAETESPVVPTATETVQMAPTFTPTSIPTLAIVVPESTDTPPVEVAPEEPIEPAKIAVGAKVVVQGAGAQGINLRANPNTTAKRLRIIAEGTVLTVIDGPQEGQGFTWWKVRTPAGVEGWCAGDWLVLKAD